MDDNKRERGIRIELDHEQKVIRVGCYFYQLKGVLICEATEEERKKYHCEKFMTYPIVDDDWRVEEDESIANGISFLTVGKKGDTVPLIALSEALDYNASNNCCDYSDVLVDVERQGIVVSNRISKDKEEQLPDVIVLEIGRIPKNAHRYSVSSRWGCYYIPRRWCYVGKDDELYTEDNNRLVVRDIADDIYSLMWFFNKPNLSVVCTAIEVNYVGFAPNEIMAIPKDWYYTVHSLERDINRRLDEFREKYPDDYNKGKLPDIVGS